MGPISWVEFQDLACPNAADAEAKAGGELWNCLAPHLEPLLLHRSPHPSLPSTGCSRRPPSRTGIPHSSLVSQARLSAPPQTAVPAAASASWRRARRASGPLSAPSPSQAPSCARSRGPNCRPGSRKLVLVLAACSSPTSPSLCAIRRIGTRAERPTSGAGNLKFDDTDRSGNRLRPSEGSRRRRGSCLLGASWSPAAVAKAPRLRLAPACRWMDLSRFVWPYWRRFESSYYSTTKEEEERRPAKETSKGGRHTREAMDEGGRRRVRA